MRIIKIALFTALIPLMTLARTDTQELGTGDKINIKSLPKGKCSLVIYKPKIGPSTEAILKTHKLESLDFLLMTSPTRTMDGMLSYRFKPQKMGQAFTSEILCPANIRVSRINPSTEVATLKEPQVSNTGH